ncbi:MAG TPA: GspE/PulE family protein [Candidatus Acidoferrum sp.]|nr:GspE/PulE family protein [Candidatus Acidoferrum sp.]
MKKKRLGEVLRERGHVSAAELEIALQDQQSKLGRLGELMLERGFVSKKDLVSALREVSPIPYLDCTTIQIAPAVIRLIPPALAKRCFAVPVEVRDSRLVVAMAEPQNLHILDELRFQTGRDIVPRLAFRAEINAAVEKYYGKSVPTDDVPAEEYAPPPQDKGIEFVSWNEQQRNIDAIEEMQSELSQKSKATPAVLLVASMIKAAVDKGASDIHVEPQSEDTAIRFRVDGMLREYLRVPRNLQNTVASRIKILADMDISERRASQDGRFLVRLAGRRIDLRISTLPTQYGEKVVMRLLESEAPSQDFEKLGFPVPIADALKRMLVLPQGMILVTGPTGSGKSTTLYSSLTFVRKPSLNIITVEDPVEYALPGLNQVQVNTKAGVTFATCLRSILRQDPNVIMIGEIRDKETAEIATKAAQTGHLVLSTLHTNDSISAVTRLLDLGMAPFQLATSLTGIIAQRLIRKLCSCSKEIPATPEFTVQLLQAGITDPPALQHVVNGCDKCDQTGYKGRIGIYEMLATDDAIRSAIRDGGRHDKILPLARRNGMKLMYEYALEHVRDGLTTMEEVLRVVPIERTTTTTLKCEACQRELAGASLFCPFCGAKGPGAVKSQQDSVTVPGMVKN